MLSTVKKTFAPLALIDTPLEQSSDDESIPLHYRVVKVDPSWGFSEFPPPDDSSKQLLPSFEDPEDDSNKLTPTLVSLDNEEYITKDIQNDGDNDFREYWMPDRLCKVCYGCEDPFTMFRRRHHCRMCGQVFCNQCSSYYIDGALINQQGLVRCCKLCHEQMHERSEQELKILKKKASNYHHVEPTGPMLPPADNESSRRSNPNRVAESFFNTGLFENPADKIIHVNILQQRASMHLEKIVKRLVDECALNEHSSLWESTIIGLVREVVSHVDPNVREGDSIDIRNYVKLKVIPGGHMDETVFVDGVVFRKNVAHKKMMTQSIEENPRILLLSGGIDFQRMDTKLSSMDTLIEQEDKYMEILVDKIMSLKPDLILVGKSVARRAQELLCKHQVVVMQNIKHHLLERISRMTGAKIVSSTDHMFQQFGQECLGTCGKFSLRIIKNDPEKIDLQQTKRILKTRIAPGTTYAYLEGCPSEKGCTIVLRGAGRDVLSEVRDIISFSIALAYHLRLEVAYYTDRCAMLPETPSEYVFEDESDDEVVDVDEVSEDIIRGISDSSTSSCLHLREPSFRRLLSTSLDIDFDLPYSGEVRGFPGGFKGLKPVLTRISPRDHQTLLFTSLLMHDNAQRSKAEIKGMRHYTALDISLGQFLVENCFGLNKGPTSMLDHTLCFVHRPGRIEITVSRTAEISSNSVDETTFHSSSRYSNMPIFMSSFCKECSALVTPEIPMSDETWKMSFGKFLEIFFYNRSARCRTGGCNHCLRDDHVLIFSFDVYSAKFNFIPIHPFSLYVRNSIDFSPEFHMQHAYKVIHTLPSQYASLIDKFRQAIIALAGEARDIMTGRPMEELHPIIADIFAIESELQTCVNLIAKNVAITLSSLPKTILDSAAFDGKETLLPSQKVMHVIHEDEDLEVNDTSHGDVKSVNGGEMPFATEVVDVNTSSAVDVKPIIGDDDSALDTNIRYPMYHQRQVYLQASSWNSRINATAKHLESIKETILQQQQQGLTAPVLPTPSMATLPIISVSPTAGGAPWFPEGEPDPHVSSQPPTTASSPNRPATTKSIRSDNPVSSSPRSQDDSHVLDEVKASHIAESEGEWSQARVVSIADHPEEVKPAEGAVVEHSRRASTSVFDYNAGPIVEGITNILKPMESKTQKPNRLTKALARFVMGKDLEDNENKFEVNLGVLGEGRLGMPPGRKGEVIPVLDDEPATIIAYSLASHKYHEMMTEFMREDYEDVDSDDDEGNAHGKADIQSADVSEKAQSTKSAVLVSGEAQDNLVIDEGGDLFDQDEEQAPVPKKSSSSKRRSLEVTRALDTAASSLNDESSTFTTFAMHDHVISGVDVPTSNPSNIQPVDATVIRPTVAASSLPTTSTFTGKFEVNRRNHLEKQLLSQRKSHIKHRFEDHDDKGNINCKFQCHTYWATQFEALRAIYLNEDENEQYIRSLSMSNRWLVRGGKSGASFSKTLDDRFVIKVINKVEMQMFLDFAPAYFEYMAKAFFHNLPTVLCKILGVYTIGYHHRETNKKVLDNVIVMENIFYRRNITGVFDLKGSSRARYLEVIGEKSGGFDETLLKRRRARRNGTSYTKRANQSSQVLLDDNLMEFTKGRPFPLKHRAKVYFTKAVTNDTLFLRMIDVVDYSILVGFDEDSHEIVVGIIDYLRKYDFLKKMERMGKSVGMLTGQAEPTIIQPPQYRNRFQAAMDRYFMTVPDKWVAHEV